MTTVLTAGGQIARSVVNSRVSSYSGVGFGVGFGRSLSLSFTGAFS
jgi:hypothetical protein